LREKLGAIFSQERKKRKKKISWDSFLKSSWDSARRRPLKTEKNPLF